MAAIARSARSRARRRRRGERRRPVLRRRLPAGHLERDDVERMGDGQGRHPARRRCRGAEIDPTPVPADYDWSRLRRSSVARGRTAGDRGPADRLHGAAAGSRCSRAATAPRRSVRDHPAAHRARPSAAWRSFLAAAARRYGPGGLFWTLHPGAPGTADHAPGRSGTSRTRPASSSPGRTSTATPTLLQRRLGGDPRPGPERRDRARRPVPLPARRPRRRASGRPTTCASSTRTPGSRPPSTGVAIHPYAGRSLGRQAPGRARRCASSARLGDTQAGDLDHRDRLGLGRQAQSAQPRTARARRGG